MSSPIPNSIAEGLKKLELIDAIFPVRALMLDNRLPGWNVLLHAGTGRGSFRQPCH